MDRRRFLREAVESAAAAALPNLAACADSSRKSASDRSAVANGPLRPHPANPRYFTDGSGRAIFLAGSHTWANLQDAGIGRVKSFDWPAYLELLRNHRHNFIRLWTWEQAAWAPWTPDKVVYFPPIYLRTGPGMAQDGEPKFDLRQFHPEYFRRMRSRIIEARDRGIYVSVMLFQGFSSKKPYHCGDPWTGHPYNIRNNVNGVDGDKNKDSVLDLDQAQVRELHTVYLRKVVDTVHDLDNVLYEVINEGGEQNWDRFVIETIRRYEAMRPKQHPVGLTGVGAERLPDMLSSSADWISPGSRDNRSYKTNPPVWDGSKVCVLDTDHLWGHGGAVPWVWKSFLRGYHTLLMDAWEPIPGTACPDMNWGPRPGYPNRNLNRSDDPTWEPIRRAMGNARSYALRMDLAQMTPSETVASSGYCLANPGKEYLVYLPEGDAVTVDLPPAFGPLAVEWMDPSTGTTVSGGTVEAGVKRTFAVPFPGPAVLYICNQLPRWLWRFTGKHKAG